MASAFINPTRIHQEAFEVEGSHSIASGMELSQEWCVFRRKPTGNIQISRPAKDLISGPEYKD